METTFYWAAFKVEKIVWFGDKPAQVSEIYHQGCFDVHPLEVQKIRREKYGQEFQVRENERSRERWELLNWKEITSEEFSLYKDSL